MGNITRDTEQKFYGDNKSLCNFTIAQTERREETLFLDCTAFGKTGELIHEHFSKGKPIILQGKLSMDSWEDKQTGQKRTKIKLIVDKFYFVPRTKDDAPMHSRTAASNAGAMPASVGADIQDEPPF